MARTIRMQVKPEGTRRRQLRAQRDGGFRCGGHARRAVPLADRGDRENRQARIPGGPPDPHPHRENQARRVVSRRSFSGKERISIARKTAAAATRAVYPIPGPAGGETPRGRGSGSLRGPHRGGGRAAASGRSSGSGWIPPEKRQDEFIFLPTEIIGSIGKSPADWDEPGWD